jgi:hypothetical protein
MPKQTGRSVLRQFVRCRPASLPLQTPTAPLASMSQAKVSRKQCGVQRFTPARSPNALQRTVSRVALENGPRANSSSGSSGKSGRAKCGVVWELSPCAVSSPHGVQCGPSVPSVTSSELPLLILADVRSGSRFIRRFDWNDMLVLSENSRTAFRPTVMSSPNCPLSLSEHRTCTLRRRNTTRDPIRSLDFCCGITKPRVSRTSTCWHPVPPWDLFLRAFRLM